MVLLHKFGTINCIIGKDPLLYQRVINAEENIIFTVSNIRKKNGKKENVMVRVCHGIKTQDLNQDKQDNENRIYRYNERRKNYASQSTSGNS